MQRQGPGQWREQYFAALEEMEHKEARWEALQGLLVRAVNRLSLAAQGLDPALDRQLEDLRHELRGEPQVASLRRRVETLSAETAHLGDAAVPGAQADLVGRLLGQIDLPASRARAVKRLVRRLRRARGDRDAILAALARQLGGAMAAASAPPPRGFWRRLLRDPRVAEEPPAPGEVVLELLGCLELPDETEARTELAALRDRLGAGEAPWRGAVGETARLLGQLIGRLSREKRDLEAFLQELTRRLRDLDQFLGAARRDLDRSGQDGDNLQQLMGQEVQGLARRVSEARDLARLKGAVQERLEAIARHLQGFHDAELHRREHAEARIIRLQAQMEALQGEAHRLRGLLREKDWRLLRDALTGVHNRAAYEDRIVHELARLRRGATPLSLLVWDVDHFKAVNDRHGHAVGDRVLAGVAAALGAKLRATDFVARYGGEEFVILLPEANAQAALYVAERIRASVAAGRLGQGDTALPPVTVSCGLTECTGTDSPESAFQRADRALYRAKGEGRDRCVVL